MKTAKISELKNRLSHFLGFVRRGQSVLVYDRDRLIARIDPIRDSADVRPEEWTAELERAGILRPPSATLPKDWLKGRPRSTARIVDALIDERRAGR